MGVGSNLIWFFPTNMMLQATSFHSHHIAPLFFFLYTSHLAVIAYALRASPPIELCCGVICTAIVLK